MSNPITRIFYLLRLVRGRRKAENSSNGAPVDLRPGEIAFGDTEEQLYIGKTDGSVATFGEGGGGGGPGATGPTGPAGGDGPTGPTGPSGDLGLYEAGTGTHSIQSVGVANTAVGDYSVISGGQANTAGDNYASVVGGYGNQALGDAAIVGAGAYNTASGYVSVVGGGLSNTASGARSSVLGGQLNNTNSQANAHIIGSNITADAGDTTFVNRLKIVDSGYGVTFPDGTTQTSAGATAAHGHGSITTDGKIGTTSGQIVVTGSGGVLTTAATISAGSVSGLATVATSGAYGDLSGKPTIPSAYTLPNATTSTLGGVIVGSGLSVTSGTVSANVTSVAGRTGAVTLTAADVGLGNVQNVDATNRANHTGTQAHTTITGLGTLATRSAVAWSTDITGIPGTFAPSAHKASHATGGSDALSPSDIGAASTSHTHAQLHDRSHAITSSSDHTATAWRAFYSNGSGVVTELPLGASGTVLTSAGTSAAPTFSEIPAGGLSDSSTYILCKTGDDIAAKYAAAKLLTPGGAALSATNRACLVIMPGVYPLTAQWEIDAEFVDVIGLGSSALERGCVVAVIVSGSDINVSANDVRITGIGTPSSQRIGITDNKPLQVFERCVGGDGSFDAGLFTTVSGTFVNCMAGNNSFGRGETVASGTFTNCTGGDSSFGYFASGTFTNCTGGDSSFGGDGVRQSGTFLGCRVTAGTFPTPTGGGVARLCYNADYSVNLSPSDIGAAGGLSDSSTYILCKTGDDIAAKYAAAKLLTPGGAALSATNRACLVIMPGVYPLTAQWEIDAEFVDVIGLGSSALERGCVVAVIVSGSDINVSANDVRITGIGTQPEGVEAPHNIKTVGGKPLQVFERCISAGTTFSYFGEGGFGSGSGIISGTFVNCMAGNNSFGGLIGGYMGAGGASGTFINCTGGYASFGGNSSSEASGTFTNCTGGDGSFGSTASGTFTNCTAGSTSFGSTASGTFTNCTAGSTSFGGGAYMYTASGTFTNCTAGDQSFGTGYNVTIDGTFINCVGGNISWGYLGPTSGDRSAVLIGCRLTSGSFPTPTGSGKQRFCLDGSYTIVNAG